MRRILLFLGTLGSFLLIMMINSNGQGKKDLDMKTYRKSVDYGIALVSDQPLDRFVSIQYLDLPSAIRFQSESWLARMLKAEASPHKSTELITQYFLAAKKAEDDLIEYRWKFSGHDLRLVQSRNAAKLEFSLKEIESSQRLDFAKSLVSATVDLEGTDRFKQNYKIELRWPDSLQNGVRLSSNPSANLLRLLRWHNRVDAFVENDVFSLLLYKKIPQLMGYQKGFAWIKEKYGISFVNDQRLDRFLSIQYLDLPASIRSQSENWLARMLKAEALPHKSTELITRYFLAAKKAEYDLIEYKWKFSGHDLRLVESLNAAKLEFSLKEIKSSQRLDFVKSFVSATVKLDGTDRFKQNYKIELRWPDSLEDGVRFSSNPSADLLRMQLWHNRVDASVEDDVFSLHLYKKIPKLIGYRDEYGWIKEKL